MCRAQPAFNAQRVGLSRAFQGPERCDTNLVAALVCPDDHSLYEYLAGEMTALDGVAHIETAPLMQFVKMHATMAPPLP